MKSTAPALMGREWNGTLIGQRPEDGYVNATAMVKANGKRWNHYFANDRTQAYIAALAIDLRSAGNPADPQRPCSATEVGNPTDPVQVVSTGPNHLRGTWIHPRLAIDLARWISPEFAVWMDGWFLEWIQGRAVAAALPAQKRSRRPLPAPTGLPKVPKNSATHGISCRLHRLVDLQERKPSKARQIAIVYSCRAIARAVTADTEEPELLQRLRTNWACLTA